MNVAELIADIESQFECRQGIFTAICNTNEPYVVIGQEESAGFGGGHYVPGVVREGASRRHWGDESQACLGFKAAFDDYVKHWRKAHGKDAHPVLWWRYDKPHLFLDRRFIWKGPGGHEIWSEKPGPRKTERCVGRGRLVLSEKPIVWADQAAYDAAMNAAEPDAAP